MEQQTGSNLGKEYVKTVYCHPAYLTYMQSESEVKSLSRVQLFATPWTVARQAPLSMGFSRQEYWSGLPFPSPGDLPNPGIEPESPALAGRFFTTSATWKAAVGVHQLSNISIKQDKLHFIFLSFLLPGTH